MPSSSRRSLFATIALTLLLAATARAELPRAEIAKRGTAATAFIQVGRASGSGFCVHPSGYFVTNEHVVRRHGQEKVDLVLDPTLGSQRKFVAKVVRTDPKLDLAILKVESTAKLPTLELGTMQNVAPLASVFAFGYPLGTALTRDGKSYPAITVGAGDVAAIRRGDDGVDRIQLDVSVTRGNSGGPVLDSDGKVVGVIVSGIRGERGLNMAIPVSRLSKFLETPTLEFTPPELTKDRLGRKMEFEARATAVVPTAKPPKLRLVLESAGTERREFPMERRDGTYVVSATPIGKEVATNEVTLTIRMKSGVLTGRAEDSPVTIAGKVYRLSRIRSIELGKSATATLADGSKVSGEIGDLGTAKVDLAGNEVSIELASAKRVEIEAPGDTTVVRATVVATVDGDEVGRVETSMWIREKVTTRVVDPSTIASTVEIAPPPLPDGAVERRLPAPFSDVCLGGGGRFLILHLPKVRRLAVFDFSTASFAGYVPLDEDEVEFAAGLDKLIVGLPRKGVLQRWNLLTLERETVVYSPVNERIETLVMGYASQGPVVLNGRFLSTNLVPLPIRNEKDEERVWSADAKLHPSGDGTVFAAWKTNQSPATSSIYVVEGNVVKRQLVWHHPERYGHTVPGPSGQFLFTGAGLTSATMKYAHPQDKDYGYCLPAVRGSYFLSMRTAQEGKPGAFTIYLVGTRHPLGRPDLVPHNLSFNGWDREEMGMWKRVYFVPQANLIATLPATNDRIVLRKLDVDAALDESGVDYLIVTSQPPRRITAGSRFEYQITAKAKKQPLAFGIATGPEGMTITPKGKIEWDVPPEAPSGLENVILTVRDAGGTEVFHTFEIQVVR